MKESYREGVANHSGPEPCEGGREAALEALDRGLCGLGIELRNKGSGMLMASGYQKATRLGAIYASTQTILRSRRPHARTGNFMRENRETSPSPAALGRAGGRTR